MGLCGSRVDQQEALARPKAQEIVTLWGDMFQPETRSIVVLIKIADMADKF